MKSGYPWLFSARRDVAAFGGSALLSCALLAIGWWLGILDGDTPDWAWIACVLLIDVAHVWSTLFRVYFDPEERQRRLALYIAIPIVSYAIGVALHSEGALLFWRVVAYLAVFHFVRQQAGWVLLYRARAGEIDKRSRFWDLLTIYVATCYPLLYWHAQLPVDFAWMLKGDFVSLPVWCATIGLPFYIAVLASYVLRSSLGWLRGTRRNPGLDLVMISTALMWFVGIIWVGSDYAFTVTNVLIHGIPYMVLVHAYCKHRRGSSTSGTMVALGGRFFLLLLVVVVVFACAEEMLWDKAIWNDKAWLFGAPWQLGDAWINWLAPLLAVPQLTHYALDGFIWRRKKNPTLAGLFSGTRN